MTNNEKCKTDSKGPETIPCIIMMYEETFYGRHKAQHKLQ